MSGGGSKKPAEDPKGSNADAQDMNYTVIPGFVAGSQGLLADQLSRGGYGSPAEIGGLLGQLYQPMNIGSVEGANGAPQYSGAAYMDALRKQLEAQGVDTNSTSTGPGGSYGQNGKDMDPQMEWYYWQTRGNR